MADPRPASGIIIALDAVFVGLSMMCYTATNLHTLAFQIGDAMQYDPERPNLDLWFPDRQCRMERVAAYDSFFPDRLLSEQAL